MAPNPGDESAEQMLLRAERYIHCAHAQCALCQHLVCKVINNAKEKKHTTLDVTLLLLIMVKIWNYHPSIRNSLGLFTITVL